MRVLSSRRRAAAGALLGGLILSASAAPVLAQSVANPNDQPTAGTLPSGTDTVRGNDRAAERPTANVSPPSAIRSTTSVVADGKRADGKRGDGKRMSGKTTLTNPSDHLSKSFRSSLEN